MNENNTKFKDLVESSHDVLENQIGEMAEETMEDMVVVDGMRWLPKESDLIKGFWQFFLSNLFIEAYHSYSSLLNHLYI